ncbi:hypothetical protein RMSM_00688 [Rhodopirellula maiorica SM1]|uniref:Uncharacterized protein n=1 Tax=Rhodopirellula maiorica SM1 TaxID=1265738 RepID=M5RT56_9BACT|nr:hypothetical protein RMSM_00688 [Rhodopirellula maiorica SM1]
MSETRGKRSFLRRSDDWRYKLSSFADQRLAANASVTMMGDLAAVG